MCQELIHEQFTVQFCVVFTGIIGNMAFCPHGIAIQLLQFHMQHLPLVQIKLKILKHKSKHCTTFTLLNCLHVSIIRYCAQFYFCWPWNVCCSALTPISPGNRLKLVKELGLHHGDLVNDEVSTAGPVLQDPRPHSQFDTLLQWGRAGANT